MGSMESRPGGSFGFDRITTPLATPRRTALVYSTPFCSQSPNYILPLTLDPMHGNVPLFALSLHQLIFLSGKEDDPTLSYLFSMMIDIEPWNTGTETLPVTFTLRRDVETSGTEDWDDYADSTSEE